MHSVAHYAYTAAEGSANEERIEELCGLVKSTAQSAHPLPTVAVNKRLAKRPIPSYIFMRLRVACSYFSMQRGYRSSLPQLSVIPKKNHGSFFLAKFSNHWIHRTSAQSYSSFQNFSNALCIKCMRCNKHESRIFSFNNSFETRRFVNKNLIACHIFFN